MELSNLRFNERSKEMVIILSQVIICCTLS